MTDTLEPPRALAQPMLRIQGGRSRAGPCTRARTLALARTTHPHTIVFSSLLLPILPYDFTLSFHKIGTESPTFLSRAKLSLVAYFAYAEAPVSNLGL